MLLSPLLSGCLVTEGLEFPVEVQCPPSIEADSTHTHSLARVVSVDRDAPPPEAFEVTIRDCNFQQELRWLAVLDGADNNYLPEGFVPADGRDPFTFDFPTLGSLVPGCHRVQLFVTERFVRGPGVAPAIPGDMGSASWWLDVTDSMTTSASMETCPR